MRHRVLSKHPMCTAWNSLVRRFGIRSFVSVSQISFPLFLLFFFSLKHVPLQHQEDLFLESRMLISPSSPPTILWHVAGVTLGARHIQSCVLRQVSCAPGDLQRLIQGFTSMWVISRINAYNLLFHMWTSLRGVPLSPFLSQTPLCSSGERPLSHPPLILGWLLQSETIHNPPSNNPKTDELR